MFISDFALKYKYIKTKFPEIIRGFFDIFLMIIYLCNSTESITCIAPFFLFISPTVIVAVALFSFFKTTLLPFNMADNLSPLALVITAVHSVSLSKASFVGAETVK
jgi:uncharacterized membrane-anchored protein